MLVLELMDDYCAVASTRQRDVNLVLILYWRKILLAFNDYVLICYWSFSLVSAIKIGDKDSVKEAKIDSQK